MLDRTVLGTSWDSVVSNGCALRIEECGGASPRSSPEPAPEQFCISRHNPNKTFRRENVIASWRGVRREREQALGKRPVYMSVRQYRDYSGRKSGDDAGLEEEEQGRARNKVKRCRSERAPTSVATAARNQVKRTYSVLYRYDRGEEKVVKEYKYLQQPPAEAGAEGATEAAPPLMLRTRSEPLFQAQAPADKRSKKAKRSLTAFLTIKTRILNIFSGRS